MTYFELQDAVSWHPELLHTRPDLFDELSSDEYKGLAGFALAVMKTRTGIKWPAEEIPGPDGEALEQLTRAIYEEQDIFDPYVDYRFHCCAVACGGCYVTRYTDAYPHLQNAHMI